MALLAGTYAETPLNTSEIPQADLDIAKKLRSNPLRWNGQFSPQLIQTLLGRYASVGSVLFDPFVGSGTVLLEAGLAGLAASGAEINPAAVTLAQTYRFINVPADLRRAHLKQVDGLLQGVFLPTFPLFQGTSQNPGHQDSAVLKSKLLELLLTTDDRWRRQLVECLIVLLDFYQPGLSADRVFVAWNKIVALVTELPFSQQPIEVFHADARQTPLADSSVNLVLTSPPYINVFNYHQQYRASVEALGWNLLRVAHSEIGSNRRNRGNRLLTVIQFCLDMAQTLRELVRVCRSDGRLIFIVGRESTVLGIPFFNGEIVAEVAHRALGFELMLRQEQGFQNRYGQRIYEDILHFSPPARAPGASYLESARDVARAVLEAAYPAASDKVKAGVRAALANIGAVQPSPLFNLPKVCTA